ncbi:alternative ribosome rescue aminoacyl-tRNA hydrolase ArfB [Gallaecimonas pentaromativorans]|uniref:Ribosome-associated protein n=1 Tax=Gallaecimonas pentaromativorans TaxID=584787 RepID=A0A3N1PSW3_9GAMM|nr:alternative ribosome rescue aminoacyl-tRNA hydrolase ArfB [Gallaecimonas pentaromativorans]MED5525326.1 alternative ribosome rescue aminoacyl-tRNA hydrolase ArfB [Pseudomonadota bacterium]ROQ27626.1 ribosome-associated protein [Gallaecimonas pentaromativorans]
MLEISGRVTIPAHELQFSAQRAQGAGGQHVNTTDSSVLLKFNFEDSQSLPDHYKDGLRRMSSHLVHGPLVVIKAQEHRSQHMNREVALERLKALIEQAGIRPKVRHATRPTRASKERRIQSKKGRGDVKAKRGKVRVD